MALARERLDDAMNAPRNKARKRASGTPAEVAFLSSGCTLLDKALGGGWALKRVANIVGDKSAGKTLLASEAAANFAMAFPRGLIRYKEYEAAFDPRYAASLGMPMDRIDFSRGDNTVEALFEELLEAVSVKVPQLVIVDSLDALTDRAETERDIDEGSYGTNKARKMSEMFRRLIDKMERADLTLMIISQVRSRIGFGFGRATTRAGGKALDFYASQVVYLQLVETINRTINEVKRPVALGIVGKLDKNKVGPPLREARFNINFGYGIDDLVTSMLWLKEVGHLDDVGASDKTYNKFIREINGAETEAEYRKRLAPIQAAVRKRWDEIESGFLPKRRKYNGNGAG